MTESIKDKVAVIGMGCTKFGERWDQSSDDLIIDACYEAFEDAGVEPQAIQAVWLSTNYQTMGSVFGIPMKLKAPITRVENACAGGTEAFRNACYAVASGVYDMALAVGVEKLKDSGYSGLEGASRQASSQVMPFRTPPAFFGMRAVAYCQKYGISVEELKKTLANIVVSSHHNGKLNPKAHFRRDVTVEQVLNAPPIAWPLGIWDCCGVSDGAAAAVIVPIEKAKNYRDDYVVVKAVNMGTGQGQWTKKDDFVHFEENKFTAGQAYRDAGIKDPRNEIDMAIVHDCFSINQLIIMEDLGFSKEGKASEDVNSGFFTIKGGLPINTDGGLKCFGHPVGASGLRMIYEVYKQIQGKVELPERQLKDVKLGLTHNIGNTVPGAMMVGMSILGRRDI